MTRVVHLQQQHSMALPYYDIDGSSLGVSDWGRGAINNWRGRAPEGEIHNFDQDTLYFGKTHSIRQQSSCSYIFHH
jgi:hypothetical protein